MFLTKIKINFFTKIFFLLTFIIMITLSLNYIFNAIFLEKYYIYRKKEGMLKILQNAKKIYLNNSEDDFEAYVYNINESKGINIIIRRSHEKMNRMNSKKIMKEIIKEIPYNKFIDKNLYGNDAKILYYGEKITESEGIFVGTSLSVIRAHGVESNIFNIITAFFALIISLSISLISSKRMTRDINNLNEKASKISKLDFSENINIERNDEIGELNENLNKMSESLSSSIDNLKSFVSNASHELKTPVAITCAYATILLENKNISEIEKIKYYDIILKTGIEMGDLIENLLILSKLNGNTIKVKTEKIKIKDCIKNSLDKYDILELKKDITINLNIETEEIISDYKLLKIVLDNLIQNALKYSIYENKIEIYEKNNYLFIENNFEGAINEEKDNLFQPFKRGQNAEDFKSEGTGIGLSIVAKALSLLKTSYSIKIIENKFIFKIELFLKR